MELEMILSLIMLLSFAILTGLLIFKKSKASGQDVNDFLQLYLVDIIRIAQTAINTLKVDRKNYEDDESYKRALASYVARELRILLEKSNVNQTLIQVLTVEVITEFIYSSFDMISDVTGYDKQLVAYRRSIKSK